LAFKGEDNVLSVRVVDYFLRDPEGFEKQNPKAEIKYLEFIDLVREVDLRKSLVYYMKSMPILDEAETLGVSDLANSDIIDPLSGKRSNLLFRSKPEKEIIRKKFNVYFKDATFKLGYLVFERNIQEIRQVGRFKIPHDSLLPEFEFIKSYFIKALSARKFDVTATITVEQGKITETKAFSMVIERIDQDVIDIIKNMQTLALTKPPVRTDVDKSLFTSEDIFDAFTDNDIEGNIFDQSEEEILKFILEKANVRNRKQLEYLAGAKQAEFAKLKFTLHPYFGFLFTIDGERMNHFIWELLNSHATYIWSFDRGEDASRLQYRRVEEAINQVRNSGREAYKMAYRDSHIDQDLLFHAIKHDDVNSGLIEGFVKWKHRLNELIV